MLLAVFLTMFIALFLAHASEGGGFSALVTAIIVVALMFGAQMPTGDPIKYGIVLASVSFMLLVGYAQLIRGILGRSEVVETPTVASS